MAATTQPLTKALVRSLFLPLAETVDLTRRRAFFATSVVPDVVWRVSGASHSLRGTRYNIADHCVATFERCGAKFTGPLRFDVRDVILDLESRSACVELTGTAWRKIGKPYNQEYTWLCKFNADNKITEVRSYFDTQLSEEVLNDPDVDEPVMPPTTETTN